MGHGRSTCLCGPWFIMVESVIIVGIIVIVASRLTLSKIEKADGKNDEVVASSRTTSSTKIPYVIIQSFRIEFIHVVETGRKLRQNLAVEQQDKAIQYKQYTDLLPLRGQVT